MSKDDQITTDHVDQMEEEFSHAADYVQDNSSDVSENEDSKDAPNLDDIRSAGL